MVATKFVHIDDNADLHFYVAIELKECTTYGMLYSCALKIVVKKISRVKY